MSSSIGSLARDAPLTTTRASAGGAGAGKLGIRQRASGSIPHGLRWACVSPARRSTGRCAETAAASMMSADRPARLRPGVRDLRVDTVLGVIYHRSNCLMDRPRLPPGRVGDKCVAARRRYATGWGRGVVWPVGGLHALLRDVAKSRAPHPSRRASTRVGRPAPTDTRGRGSFADRRAAKPRIV